ncbi:hypothetical protein CHS0354_008016 [Potamilus streckersoni]|uniref:Uncharacterized protein n=1 Tax=Potamilus streckersoni TaxID=2493646 RepID=A0AAE0T1M7_9BIVA|nr:hypothetical protein CHS0354_008016 [Potamilus streckersoni]
MNEDNNRIVISRSANVVEINAEISGFRYDQDDYADRQQAIAPGIVLPKESRSKHSIIESDADVKLMTPIAITDTGVNCLGTT